VAFSVNPEVMKEVFTVERMESELLDDIFRVSFRRRLNA